MTLLGLDMLSDLDRRMLRRMYGRPRVAFDAAAQTFIYEETDRRMANAKARGARERKEWVAEPRDVALCGVAAEVCYSLWAGFPVALATSNAFLRDDFPDGTDTKGSYTYSNLLVPSWKEDPSWRYAQVLVDLDMRYADLTGWISATRFRRERKRPYWIKGSRRKWFVAADRLNPMEVSSHEANRIA